MCLGRADPLAAVIECHAVGPDLGEHAATHPVGGFDECEVDARVVESKSCGQSRVAATHDDHLGFDQVHFGLFPHGRRACSKTDSSVNRCDDSVRKP